MTKAFFIAMTMKNAGYVRAWIVQALVRDKASENWGRLLELTDADGQLHRWAMPMEMLKGSGEELRGELLRLGLQIAPGMKARQGLVEYITTTQPDTRARCVTTNRLVSECLCSA